MNMKNKNVVVTGGTRGIGFAIAKKMINSGARVLITGRNEETLKSAVNKLGDCAEFMVWDISKTEENKEKLQQAEKSMGHIDVLVNNAGVLESDWSGILNTTPEDWDRTMDTNLKGVYFLSQAFARMWVEKKQKGKIINICSNNAYRALDTPYAASKWALRGLTMGMAKRLAPYGIIVNGVAPGCTSTSMLGLEDGEPCSYPEVPLGRYSFPDEIANVCVFLASEASGSILGQIIVADGGEILK